MSGTRVLLADDYQPMLELVERVVISLGHEVVGKVGDGDALVEAAQRLEPGILILDIAMPGLSGIEATRRLKSEGASAGVILLTVHEHPDLVRAAMEAGALGYVVKSRMLSDLHVAIEEALAGRSFVSPSVLEEAE